MALSFQEAEGCAAIWYALRHASRLVVQGDLTVHSKLTHCLQEICPQYTATAVDYGWSWSAYALAYEERC